MRCLLSMSHQKKYRGYVCGGWNKFNCGQKKSLTRSYDKFSNARHSTIKWQLRKHFLCVSADHSAFLHLLFLLTIFFARKMRGKKCAKKIENYQQVHVRSHFWKIADEFTQLLLSHHHHHPHIEEGKIIWVKKIIKNTRFEEINEIS